MSECFRKIFLFNGVPRPCREFPNELVFSGKSLYEVIRLHSGISVFLEDHVNRFRETARVSHQHFPYTSAYLIKQIQLLQKENNVTDGNVKIVYQTGNENKKDHLLLYFLEHHYPTREQYNEGIPVTLYRAERDMPTAKILNMNLRAAIFKKLIDTHSYEALLVDKNEFIREGSRSNVFFILGNSLYTAPDDEVLAGIARKYILEICKKSAYPVRLQKIHITQLPEIQGAFISGTSPGILGISAIDNLKINPDHKITREIHKAYFENIEAYLKKH